MTRYLLAPALALVAVGCREDAGSPTAPEPNAALATSTNASLAFRQVSVTWFHTCGVTTDNVAYCWGENAHGQLGDGTTNDSPTPVRVAGGLLFRQVTTGTAYTCGIALDELTYCWGENHVGQLGDETTMKRLRPTRVHAGGLRFRRVTAGASHTCGETTDNLAYCWGSNMACLGMALSASPA